LKNMQRRKFIKKTAIAAGVSGVLQGIGFRAQASAGVFAPLLLPGTANDHILVVIQMSGGNDGLNTVIPLDQYNKYVNARSNIAIAENKVLALTGTNATGLHPSLTGIRDMYNEGQVCIVQAAGYPNPNFSHFRATDIWMTAGNSDEYLTDGWLGRYLNGENPGFPNGYPNAGNPDPLAIQFGSGASLALLGPVTSMGYVISDPDAFINNANGGQDVVDVNTPMGEQLQYMRDIANQAELYNVVVKTAFNRPGNTNLTGYPTNKLADQLKIVARLINGGLQTKIYVVNIGGFDTHAAQTNNGDTSTGTHAELMSGLGDSIKAFHTDLKLMNKDQRVLGMTFSEFGRRIRSNGSGGTDHGYGAPLFIFGSQATGGIIGNNPILPTNASVNDNVPMQNDFRNVYYSIMKRWLCQDSASLQQIMLHNYNELNICNNSDCAPLGRSNTFSEVNYVNTAPNPATDSTIVSFETMGGHTLLQLVTKEGMPVQTLLEATYSAPQTINRQINLSAYKTGLYYIRFQNGRRIQMKPLVIAR
jgi:uncharacterized protein (DUF1501 family)